MKAVELYAGAGGLAMGVSMAGFQPLAVIEWNRWAADTLRRNKERGFELLSGWPLTEGDVRTFDWSNIKPGIELLAGGPPCQPFSMGGKHRAHDDNRDMFPATVEIVRKLQPKAFIVENVKGLTRASFAEYFRCIIRQLENPEIAPKKGELWSDHLRRLDRAASASRVSDKLRYKVKKTLVNAADFGVPQKRERVFIVGFRDDLAVDWDFPAATHSLERLLYDQWVTGEYWSKHRISVRRRPELPTKFVPIVRRLNAAASPPAGLPWVTVRDAICDLPDPQSKASLAWNDHKFQPGAKAYPGHTGSPLDMPAKTLKAGDHGVPGGENMLVQDDGTVRYFTVRESARIQTFPDDYIFNGSWTETMRQLGNAVPVLLGHVVAHSVAISLAKIMDTKLNVITRNERQAA